MSSRASPPSAAASRSRRPWPGSTCPRRGSSSRPPAGRSGWPTRQRRPLSGRGRRTAGCASGPSPIESGKREAGDDQDLVGQRVELLGQRRLFGVCCWSMPEMWPTSVSMPVAVDDDRGRATGDLRVHERHVDAIAQGRIGGDWLDLLRYRRHSRRSGPTRRSRGWPHGRSGRRPAPGRPPRPSRCRRARSRPSSTTWTSPPRRTRVLTTIIFCSAATLASALPSWLMPRKALKQRQPDQDDAGRRTGLGMNRLTMPATSSTICIGSGYWRRKHARRDSRGRVSELVGSVFGASRLDLGGGKPGRLLDSLILQGVFDSQGMPGLLGRCRRCGGRRNRHSRDPPSRAVR